MRSRKRSEADDVGFAAYSRVTAPIAEALARGDTAEARARVDELLRVTPLDYLAHQAAAEFYMLMGHREGALRAIATMLALRADLPRAFELLAHVLSGQAPEVVVQRILENGRALNEALR